MSNLRKALEGSAVSCADLCQETSWFSVHTRGCGGYELFSGPLGSLNNHFWQCVSSYEELVKVLQERSISEDANWKPQEEGED